MKRVVVPIQAIQERRFGVRLRLVNGVGFLALGWREIDGAGTFGPAPVALANEEGGSKGFGVHVSALFSEDRLRLDDGAGFAFVVDAYDCGLYLEDLALAGRRERLEELNGALPIDDAPGVELGNTRDGSRGGSGVEVYDFLVRVFECLMRLSNCPCERGDFLLVTGSTLDDIQWRTKRIESDLRRMIGYAGKTWKFGCSSYKTGQV